MLISKLKRRKCRAGEIKVVNPACKAGGNLDISMEIICFNFGFSFYAAFEGGKINRPCKFALTLSPKDLKDCRRPGPETD